MYSSNLVSQIIAYENGDLSPEETLDLFSALVETGAIWHLQGHYQRTAAALDLT